MNNEISELVKKTLGTLNCEKVVSEQEKEEEQSCVRKGEGENDEI